MKHPLTFLLSLFLGLAAQSLQAQECSFSIGQVKYGEKLFDTGISYEMGQEILPMSKKARENALKIIERTFGTVTEHQEYWGECTELFHLRVTLEGGDVMDFWDGKLVEIELVSPRLCVAKEWFKKGLRVGQPQPEPVSQDIVVTMDGNVVDFNHLKHPSDTITYFTVDDDGIIVSIRATFNPC